MSANPPSLSPAEEPLDEITEQAISDAIRAGRTAKTEDALISAHIALRARIRQLVAEAVLAEKQRILTELNVIELGEMTHVDYDDD